MLSFDELGTTCAGETNASRSRTRLPLEGTCEMGLVNFGNIVPGVFTPVRNKGQQTSRSRS